MVLADVDDAVADDDAGKMEDVPLEGDSGIVCGFRDGVRARGVADDPEIDDFEGQSESERQPKSGMKGSHITRDG